MSTAKHTLICGVNWIGDAVLSMPGLQAYRRAHPDDRMTMLVKPGLADLWQGHEAIDGLLFLPPGGEGTRAAIAAVKAAQPTFTRAYILPNSFRSAWIPWRAGVPHRIGYAGHFRSMLLTERRRLRRPGHQVFETYDLLLPNLAVNDWEPPSLPVTAPPVQGLAIALLPGAARGPAKQWPESHFVEVGRRLALERGAQLWVLGTLQEQALCDRMAAAIGPAARSLAGRTTFGEWMQYLQQAAVVLCNDSGGMHVAAALGRPLVAFFGLTDPRKTGPLSKRTRILQKVEPQGRDIARVSAAAASALASITPDEAFAATLDLLENQA